MSLYMTDGECHLRAQNHAECSRAGIVNHREIRERGDALVASLKPVLDQVHLTGPEALELRREMTREPLPAEAAAARHDDFIAGMRTPIYATTKHVAAKAQATKAAAHASPELRRALNTGNAGNSVTLGRALYRRFEAGDSIVRPAKVSR